MPATGSAASAVRSGVPSAARGMPETTATVTGGPDASRRASVTTSAVRRARIGGTVAAGTT
ncbi:hypothetical protein Misp04_19830 [Micromonospora sp. NBRC 101691]|nr:hypothetical protein Misp04_19830 [Micromonospora sp. NBRC 101691]